MSTMKRGAVFALTVVTVAVVGVVGVQAIRSTDPAGWPDRVAVIGLDENARQPVTYLGLADPVRQVAVSVPTDAVVEIPGSGFLRAYHAYRLGGTDLVRETLERLFGVDVPFSVSGPGTGFEEVAASFTSAQVPSGHLEELRTTLEGEGGRWDRIEVSGTRKEGAQGSVLILDPGSVSEVARAVGGLGTKVFVDPTDVDALVGRSPAPEETPVPTPSETIAPSEIAVDVLNGGDVELAATKTSERLEALGYRITRIADHPDRDHEESFVYHREGQEAAARQVALELGYPFALLPEEGVPIKESADVVVLLGHDAQVD